MTRSLGTLGTPHDPIDATFEFFGVIVRVNPNAGDLELMEFLMNAAEIEEVDQMKSMSAISRYLKGLIHDEDWDTFWRTAKANRQTMDDLMMLGRQIVEAASGFPTSQPSGSAPGHGSTPQRSKGGSSSPAGARKRAERRDTEVKRALELVQGRPDLKEIYLQAEEARAAG